MLKPSDVGLYASFLAATLFVPVAAGLHWSRPGKTSTLTGTTAGAGTVLLWQVGRMSGVAGSGLSAVDPVVPGLLCSFVAVAGTTALGR